MESRAAALRVEIDSESTYAEMAATAAFRELQMSIAFSEEWAFFTQAASTAVEHVASFVSKVEQGIENVAEEAWDNYIKPAGKWMWNGIEEFLDFPRWNPLGKI